MPYVVSIDFWQYKVEVDVHMLSICTFAQEYTCTRIQLKGLHRGLAGRLAHIKRKFSKTCFFLLSTCVGDNSISCDTFLLSVGNSLKTCIISVDLGKALLRAYNVYSVHSKFKPSCQIDRGHTNY